MNKKGFLIFYNGSSIIHTWSFGFSISSKSITTRVIGTALILFVVLRYSKILKFKPNGKTLVLGEAVTGLLSGLTGSTGPIGAAVFPYFGLPR
ncbi:MAG TPA: hypothetical protein VN414_10130 [Methanosarcina sp.]|nr:hypothetical protein [Methanosarcina sp.]